MKTSTKMENIKFNYRSRQSYPIVLNISSDEIQKFEENYKEKLFKKYQDRLISPRVEVVVSNDGMRITDVHSFADGILN